MFDRKKYKNYALRMLKGRWGVPILTTFVTGLIMAIFAIPAVVQILRTEAGQSLMYGDFETISDFYLALNEATSASVSQVLSFIQSAVSSIVGFAALGVYLKLSRSPAKVSFSTFIEGFNNCWKAIRAFVWQTLWVFLWSLLFVVPGLIKYYAYSQMFFILNEFENVSVTKAMRISMIITQGHKWDIFIMDLSFIGWDILATLSFGIGNLWVTPYRQMTWMNAFHAMMKEAIEMGKIKPEDLH